MDVFGSSELAKDDAEVREGRRSIESTEGITPGTFFQGMWF